MISISPTELVLGRGEVYFEPFAPGTRTGMGERYIGNTLSFLVAREIERTERKTSFKGQKTDRESPVISERITAQLITDNISLENIGLFYGQETDVTTVPADSEVEETHILKRGNYYQLGRTVYPNGVREVLDVSIKINGVEIPAENNFDVDYDLGRIWIFKDGQTIANGSTGVVKFSWRTSFSQLVTSKAQDMYGAMRFISKNVVGARRNAFFPFVRVSPRGGIDLKGDQWQQIPFDVVVMRLGPFVEQAYIDAVVGTGSTQDEQSIIDYGGISVDDFPYWEDQLDQIINFSMPASDYGQVIP